MELFNYLENMGLRIDEQAIREALHTIVDMLIDMDVSSQLDAAYYERSRYRAAYRNGYRQRLWKTQLGTITLKIPKLRRGTYTPQFINQKFEQGVLSLIKRAYVSELAMHDVTSFLAQLHLSNLDAQVLFDYLDGVGFQLRETPIQPDYPFLWLDVVQLSNYSQKIAAIAIGLRENGEYDLLGFMTGYSRDDEDFWLEFVRSLANRGLSNVQLVISDAYRGVKAAIYEELFGAEWQYSQLHFLRTLGETVSNTEKAAITDAISTILLTQNRDQAVQQLRTVVRSFKLRYPQAMAMLESSQNDLLAYTMLSFSQQVSLNLAMISIKQNLFALPDAIGLPLSVKDTQTADYSVFPYEIFQPVGVL